MIRFISLILLCLLPTAASAQTATATGTGVGVAKSQSASQAVAIGGGAAQGGNSASNLTVNNPAVTTSNQNQTVSGTQTIRNVPTVFAPGLAAAGLETCLGSVSAGVGVIGTGVSFGTTIPDAGCAARLDSRTLWAMGLKKAAVARLCITPDIYRSMPEICAEYLPAPPGYAPVVASSGASEDAPAYNGGPVEVVIRSTGVHRWCNDYDVTRQRCRVWAHGH